jgi:hypothetical protein
MEPISQNQIRIRYLTILAFVVSLILFFILFSRFTNLHGGDAYYHLAVARAYAQQGVTDTLSWARFSAMHDGFGDKEFLFHIFLVPFVKWLPHGTSAHLALAVLNAVVFALLAYFGLRGIGWWGLLAPLWVFGTSAAFTLRMTRLRPEILALIIFLLITWVGARKKHIWVLVLAAIFTLSYTAWQALLGLCLGWFLYSGWIGRKWEWRLLAGGVAGVVFGLLLHPHFPHNLKIWVIQNVDYFSFKTALPVGSEILSTTTKTVLDLNLGWIAGLFVFWRSIEKDEHGSLQESEKAGPAAFFLVNGIAFTLLYLLMQRFSIYCIPFVTLALFFEIQRRGKTIGRWTYLPWRGKIPFAMAFGICLCTSMVGFGHIYNNLKQHGVFQAFYTENWKSIEQAIPKNAHVAAPWDHAEIYVWAAPQAKYLNVLDPVFMAKPYPQTYRWQRRVWTGQETDVPLITKTSLDSDYLLFPFNGFSKLNSRLRHDPRVEAMHQGIDVLYRIKPPGKRSFVMDWKVVPLQQKWPPSLEDIQEKGWPYPRHPDPVGRAVEGYVNGLRIRTEEKWINFVHVKDVDTPVLVTYELAPYGSCIFWHNDRQVVEIKAPLEAVLGQGMFFSLSLDKGRHRFTVHTGVHQQQAGFYLLERRRVPLTSTSQN